MATKKISDLQLRSDADGTINFAVDDASQTWRVTAAQLLAYILGTSTLGSVITALTAKTAPVAADELILADSAASYAAKKITKSNLQKKTVRAATTTDSVAATDDVLIASGASFTFTLPAASGLTGKILTFKHNDATLGRVYTIDGNASETIDGVVTKKICTQGETLQIICDGSNWFVLDRRIQSEWTTYTPTWTGFGTVSSNTAEWRRVGDSIHIRGSCTGGTTTATEARASIPSGLTSAGSGKIQALRIAGPAGTNINSVTRYCTTLIEASVAYMTFGMSDGALSAASFVKQNGNVIGGGGSITAFDAVFPIADWEA